MGFHNLRLEVGIKLQGTPFVKRWIFFSQVKSSGSWKKSDSKHNLSSSDNTRFVEMNTFQKKACVLTNDKWSVNFFFYFILFF